MYRKPENAPLMSWMMGKAATRRKQPSVSSVSSGSIVVCANSSLLRHCSVFPLFMKGPLTPEHQTTFSWAPALGPQKTCLHGINLSPEPLPKVAAFDLDGCLIDGPGTKSKGKTRSDEPSFKWWRPIVPNKLKEVHEQGCVSYSRIRP